MSDFQRPISGEPIKIKIGQPFIVCCCDCGLTHIHIYERASEKDTIFVRVYRDEYLTQHTRAEDRKRRKKKGGKNGKRK